MKQRERKVLAVIPLNLDGYLLSGKAKQCYRGWRPLVGFICTK
jgi:hypothetical protein